MWTWGEPWGDFSMQVDRTPRRVPGAVNIAKIVCGAFHNLALNKYACVACRRRLCALFGTGVGAPPPARQCRQAAPHCPATAHTLARVQS